MSEHREQVGGGEAALAFLLGGLVGAGLALLFAPAPGDETREKVGDWLKSARRDSERFLKEKRDAMAREKDRLRSAFETGKQAYEEGRGADQPGFRDG